MKNVKYTTYLSSDRKSPDGKKILEALPNYLAWALENSKSGIFVLFLYKIMYV